MEKPLHSPKTTISKFSRNQACGAGIKDHHRCMSIVNRSPEAQALIRPPTFGTCSNLNSTKYPQATGSQSIMIKTLVLSHMDHSMVPSSRSQTEKQEQADKPRWSDRDKCDKLLVPGQKSREISRLTVLPPSPIFAHNSHLGMWPRATTSFTPKKPGSGTNGHGSTGLHSLSSSTNTEQTGRRTLPGDSFHCPREGRRKDLTGKSHPSVLPDLWRRFPLCLSRPHQLTDVLRGVLTFKIH